MASRGKTFPVRDENRLFDVFVDMVVYQGATHGEHAGKLSALLTTKTLDVYGRGMNTLVTNSQFNGDYPMQEGGDVRLSGWVKVEKLCKVKVQKIVVGFGWGAAITVNWELVVWGMGATTYLRDAGIETIQVYDPGAACRFCAGPCDYARRIGNTAFSYCKQQQTLVKYNSSPPPPDVPVKRLGNRRYGALTCSVCLKDCDIEVMENCSFNYCNTCNELWDVDKNSVPMNFKSVPMESFLRKLDFPVKVRDIAPGWWGIWILADLNHIRYSAFFMHPDTVTAGMPLWWKQSLSVPFLKPPHNIISTHSTKTDVFAVTDNGLLYRRDQVLDKSRSNGDKYNLSRIPLETTVKKMCCGRSTSLCLLEDGTIWMIYSQKNRKDPKNDTDQNVKEQADVEELLSERGSYLDVTGILYADLFYVHASTCQVPMKRKNPLTDTLFEILVGDLDCKTFLWNFSGQCRVTSEGWVAYDKLAFARLIKYRQDIPQAREVEQSQPFEISESQLIPVTVTVSAAATVTSTGLGFPVGDTLWLSWSSHLLKKAAVGWRCFTVLAKRVYNSALKKVWHTLPQLGNISSSDHLAPEVVLPPFQVSLYGQTQFSDLTVQLQDGIFPAHRVILCTTSKYFKAQFSSSKVDIRSLDMKRHNPRACRWLLKYFYSIEPERLNINDMLDLLLLAKLYDERQVAFSVEEHIKNMIDVDNVTKIMEFATGNGSRRLQDGCELFMKSDPAFKQKYGTSAIAAGMSAISDSTNANLQQR